MMVREIRKFIPVRKIMLPVGIVHGNLGFTFRLFRKQLRCDCLIFFVIVSIFFHKFKLQTVNLVLRIYRELK